MRSPRMTAQLPKASAPASLVLAELESALVRHIGRERYDLWFAQHTRLKSVTDEVLIGVPNLHFQEWLAKRFHREVVAAVNEVCGQPLPIRYVIEPELFQQARARQEAAREEAAKRKPVVIDPPAGKFAAKPHELYEASAEDLNAQP